MGWATRLAGIRVDTAPLRESRDFRLLFLAGTVFYLGAMMVYVAVPFQIYDLTGSNFAVGAVGIVELVPLVLFGLYGGALADHVDRRRMLIGTGVLQALSVAALMTNALLDEPRLWVILATCGVLAAAGSLQRPSLEALEPRTVRHDQIGAASALSGFGAQLGLLAGPALGGVLLASVGAEWCYLVDLVGLSVAIALFWALRPHPHVLGLLYTAETIGGLAATVTSGWAARVHHHGRAIVVAAAAYGLAIACVGLAPSIGAAVVCLALAGAADTVSGIFRRTIWNQTVPDTMRGRLAGIELLSYSVGPIGGQVRAGLVADMWSVRGSIVSGGVLCVAGVVATSAWLRDFWSYDARTDEHAVRERRLRADPPAG